MSEVDPREELFELTRAFRLHLEWHGRAGASHVPGGPSAPAASSASAASTASDRESVESSPGLSDGAGQERAGQERAGQPESNHQPPSGSGFAKGEFAAFADSLDGAPKRGNSLAQIRAELGDCQRCKLGRTRTKIVFGDGAADAALMFIGEGPGANEDRRGLPFVGEAGQLLDRMIKAMGWSRQTVYIANVVKCRPPGNRTPEPDEIASCRPFLARQIRAVNPRIIVTLGRPAANLVLQRNAPIHSLRGHFQEYEGIKVMPTFHPAYLLHNVERQRELKRDTWSDLKQVIAELDRIGVRPPFPVKG